MLGHFRHLEHRLAEPEVEPPANEHLEAVGGELAQRQRGEDRFGARLGEPRNSGEDLDGRSHGLAVEARGEGVDERMEAMERRRVERGAAGFRRGNQVVDGEARGDVVGDDLELGGHRRAQRALDHRRAKTPVGHRADDLADPHPGARCREDAFAPVERGFGRFQKVGPGADEGRHRRVEPAREGDVLEPVRRLGLDAQMHEPVRQRGAEVMGHRPVLDGIAGGDDQDRGGQPVPAHAAFLQETVDHGLQGRRRGGQLVEKQDRRRVGVVGQVLRAVPDRPAGRVVVIGQPPEILRLDRGQPEVEEPRADLAGELLHDLGLADARAAVKHPRNRQRTGRLRCPARAEGLERPARGHRLYVHAHGPRLGPNARLV